MKIFNAFDKGNYFGPVPAGWPDKFVENSPKM
jgi:hypothetical protein